MNIKMLGKLSKKIKYEETDKDGVIFYEVYQWSLQNENWRLILSTTRQPKALQRKHNAWLCAMHTLGYTTYLFDRRKKRIRQKAKKLKCN